MALIHHGILMLAALLTPAVSTHIHMTAFGDGPLLIGIGFTYVTKQEVAERLRRHVASVMRLVRQGILPPPIRLAPGGPLLFIWEEVEQAVQARREPAKPLPKKQATKPKPGPKQRKVRLVAREPVNVGAE
jgi:hypothetical protein